MFDIDPTGNDLDLDFDFKDKEREARNCSTCKLREDYCGGCDKACQWKRNGFVQGTCRAKGIWRVFSLRSSSPIVIWSRAGQKGDCPGWVGSA